MPTPPVEHVQEITGDRSGIESLTAGLLGEMERRKYPEASRFAVRLALEEAASNAFKHGHKGAREPVRVRWSVGDDELTIEVEDRGQGFDPAKVADPTLDANLEIPAGRGIMLMRAYMSEVRFNERGNAVTMVYRRSRRPGQTG